MNRSAYTPLMHAVLDGEAGPGEAAELARLLAANPAAQAEFDELQRLFEGLKAIPKVYPPEGLVHAVMTALPAGSPVKRHDSGGIRQPFSSSRVIGAMGEHSMEAPATIPGKSATVHPISQRGPYFRGDKNMSEQNTSSVGNRKIWIGAGVAAAAVIVAVSTGVLPPSGKDTAGTIVPAQRYMAPQGTAADVKLGNPSATSSTTAIPAAQDAAANAANAAAANSANAAAANSANAAAANSANAAASNAAAASAANKAASSAASSAANAAAANSANSAASNAANAAASNAAAASAANKAANSAAGNAANAAASNAANAAANSSAANAANKSANAAAANSANAAASNAANAAASNAAAASAANKAANSAASSAANAAAANSANAAASNAANAAASNAAAASAANKAANSAASNAANAAANSSSKQ
jgi:hypothetical protein